MKTGLLKWAMRPLLFMVLLAGWSLALTLVSAGSSVAGEHQSFEKWLKGFRAEAAARGISDKIISLSLSNAEPIERVLELDRRQPEFTLTFWRYLNGRVTDKRIRRGRQMMAKHKKLLDQVAVKYGVQPRFLAAFWGLESNFGDYTGVFPLVNAVATLAHDPRRDDFFREQLIAALMVMERGDIPVDAKSSWAGAMGNLQFIPTTYRDFAIDFDGDSRRDLWGSLPDVFASAANYLSRSGWRKNQTWGREIKLPGGFDLELAGLKIRKKLSQWQTLGVRRVDGRDLPSNDIVGSIVLPAGYNGPAFIVYNNFRTILRWNRSILYAIAVGHLADRLDGKGRFLTPVPAKEMPMSRDDVIEAQRRLMGLGFDTFGADGIVGQMTREAIKGYQRSVHLPPDGFLNMGLLERLRSAK